MVMVTITQVWFPSSLLSGWLWVTPLFLVRFIPVTHSEMILYWTYVRFGHNNSLPVHIVIQLCDRQTDRQRTEIFSVVDYFSSRTRSLSLVTLARPSVSSSLQITNRSFTYASPYLWNQFPSSFRQPHSVHCPPGSPYPAHITSSQSPPSLSSPITAFTFHSRLKTHLFHKCYPP